MRWNDYIIDISKQIKKFNKVGFSMFEAGCEVCGENPCVCGSKSPREKPCKECKAEDPHKNLEQLAKKIVPLVNEINEELERHASVCKKKMWADKDAGYPPNCKKGFVEKDGKCVPEKKDEATHDPRKKGFHGSDKNVDKNVDKKDEATHDPRKKGFHASDKNVDKNVDKKEKATHDPRKKGFHASDKKEDKNKAKHKSKPTYSSLWKKVNKKDNI